MAATDYISAIYAKLWELLEEHAGFTGLIKPGNRIKLNAAEADPFAKGPIQDADLRQAILSMGATGSDSMYTTTGSYAFSATAAPANLRWIEVRRQDFTLVL